ncbi:MAG TPA: FAD-dependent oxidoreductase [Alphaproteobacteria bacterium]|nr:FAD-dependent oxidoreductase [Alphaproteobacteria bacterium]
MDAAPREVDLLVAGAGPAGMAAALAASLEGLDVLVCEKSEQVGGTGSTSAGTLWVPGNHESQAAGFPDSAEAALRYLDALIPDRTARPLRLAYLETGPAAIDYFSTRTDVQFLPCGMHPDYRGNLPGAAVAGRAIIPKPFDGRVLGADFARIRPPIPEYMVLGGMMVGKLDIPPLLGRFKSATNFLYTAKLVGRYLADRLRYPRGTRLMMGNALIARLFYSLKKRRVPILFGAEIADVLGDRRAVNGARLRIGGEEIVVKARRGVVLATGGIAHNKTFRARFMPQGTVEHSMSHAGNSGDGLTIATRLGARIAPATQGHTGLWTPASLTVRRDGSRGLYPHLILDRAKPGLLAVNAGGRRFVNEAVSYHDFVEAMIESHATAPSIPAYLVCNSEFIRKYGLGDIYPGTRNLKPFERSGYLLTAGTLEQLAGKIGCPPDALRATVERHDRFAAAGVDEDFGKGETELNRFNGDPEHKPNPCLGPLGRPPFHAMAVWPADIAISTGLATDADARVLGEDGRPIAGLYACGNDMASIMAGMYPGPGTTLGPALVFAYRAVMHARGNSR